MVQAKGTGREQAVQGQSQAVNTLNLLSRLSREQEVTNSHERSQQTGLGCGMSQANGLLR